jgi:hypothetical protein
MPRVSSLGAVDPADARAALAVVAPRVSRLVRAIDKPLAHAVGNWNAADVAVHIVHAWENLTALADSEIDSPLQDIASLAALTETLVDEETDRELGRLADRIDACAAAFLAHPLAGATHSPWLIEGMTVPRVTLACHLLSESLVHGHDIARTQRVPWRIEPAHAGLALLGFAFPVLARLDPRALVHQEAARGFNASYEIRVRGAGTVFLSLRDGAMSVQTQPVRSVDCHLSADPATLLLLLFGRVSQWPALLTGRLLAWGPKPWLAPKLRQVLRNP